MNQKSILPLWLPNWLYRFICWMGTDRTRYPKKKQTQLEKERGGVTGLIALCLLGVIMTGSIFVIWLYYKG